MAKQRDTGFLKSKDRGSVHGKTWLERHKEAVSVVSAAVDDDACVLVHCVRGLHRTGPFITLWVALRMRSQGDRRLWLQVLSDAWEHFKTGRRLAERSTSGRDFETESWDAVLELYGTVGSNAFGVRPGQGPLPSVVSVAPTGLCAARRGVFGDGNGTNGNSDCTYDDHST